MEANYFHNSFAIVSEEMGHLRPEVTSLYMI